VIVFVDTSALFALLDEDDLHHTDAVALFRALEDRADLVTTNYVEVEAIALVRRRLGMPDALRLVDSILPVIRTLWVDKGIHASAIAAWRLGSGFVSAVDRVSFEVMRAMGIELCFAFDAEFEAEGFRRPPAHPSQPHSRVNEQTARYSGAIEAETIGDPVSVAEIAARSGRSINTVQSWRRRHADFPAPAMRLAAAPVWNWPVVEDWIAARR
jgi:predicted nucleic acid-binding protein